MVGLKKVDCSSRNVYPYLLARVASCTTPSSFHAIPMVSKKNLAFRWDDVRAKDEFAYVVLIGVLGAMASSAWATSLVAGQIAEYYGVLRYSMQWRDPGKRISAGAFEKTKKAAGKTDGLH